MGLIYVNPEGPNGEPDPLKAAHDIRETFAPDGDERRGDRRADRRRPLVRQDPRRRSGDYVGPEPEGCPVIGQGLGWQNTYGTGKGADAITCGLEVTWTSTPTQWGNGFFDNLFGHEWELEQSPAGAHQWVAKDAEATIPDPDGTPNKRKPTMLTTDLALRMDPEYEKISRRFHEDLDEFRLAFAKAWYKLLHRDMGPVDPLPRPVGRRAAAVAGPGPGPRGPARLRRRRRRPQGQGARLRPDRRRSWSARRGRRRRRFRGTDKRGGANGARIRLAPQKDWEVNEPAELGAACSTSSRQSRRSSTAPAAPRSRSPT